MGARIAVASVVVVLLLPRGASAQPHRAGPAEVCDLSEAGCYEDRDGRMRLSDEAYYRAVARPRPDPLRAAIELGATLGLGAIWYWLSPVNEQDWDFPPLRDRLSSDILRFDTNSFALNHLGHGFDGMAWHVLARSNHLSLGMSVLFAFVTSLLWEYALEFREYVSLNDVVATPIAGTALGEFAYWLGRYLHSGDTRGPVHRAARVALGAPQAIHDALDGDNRRPDGPTRDGLGISTDVWHRFAFGYGLSLARPHSGSPLELHVLRAEAELAAMPGRLRPGRFDRVFSEGNFTRSSLRFSLHGNSSGADSLTEAVLFGYYTQSIPAFAQDGPGQALMLGAATAFHYRRERYGSFRDRFALMHLPGLAVDWALVGSELRLDLSARLHGDFASIQSLAYRAWAADNPQERGKSVLRRHGYYYGYGLSGRLGFALRAPHFSLEGRVMQGRYRSIQGADRWPERLTIDEVATDRLAEWEGLLRILPVSPLFVVLRATYQVRASNVEEVASRGHLARYQLELGAEL